MNRKLVGKDLGQANLGDSVTGVYYRPPNQEGGVNEAFCRQMKVAS